VYAIYTQTNVGLLCCVGSGSNVAIPLEDGSAQNFMKGEYLLITMEALLITELTEL